MTADIIERGARAFIAQHLSRENFAPIEKPASSDPVGFAYDVQDKLIGHIQEAAGASAAAPPIEFSK